MNLTTLLSSFGLGDGVGNTSITRVVAAALLACWMGVKVSNAVHNHTDLVFSAGDLQFLVAILGTLVGKTVAEGIAAKLTPPNNSPLTPPNNNP